MLLLLIERHNTTVYTSQAATHFIGPIAPRLQYHITQWLFQLFTSHTGLFLQAGLFAGTQTLGQEGHVIKGNAGRGS